METAVKNKRLYRSPFFQVTVGIAFGIAIGFFVDPHFVEAYLKPLGNGFIKLIRAMITPIVFGTVVVGIAALGDIKKAGRIGFKALVYFEVVTTMALIIGLVVVHLFQPGAGMNADPAKLDISQISRYTAVAKSMSTMDFFMNIIPTTIVEAFTKGEILQVLFIAILFGAGLNAMGQRGKHVVRLIDGITHGFFKCAHYIMKLAPVGAGGALAYAISKYGTGTLTAMLKLLLGVWGSAFLFVVIVLGLICKVAGFSIWRLFLYIKEEVLIVFGTSSSETVLPRLISKLENCGVQKSVVGLVVPAGYSFNLDGTSIYLAMAAIFIAQAFNVHLTLGQELTIVAVLMLTSKGAAAVAGGTFICLAATLSSLEVLPVSGLVLLLGVDWFMATCRALTNMIGNAVATIVIARWENAIDMVRFTSVLYNEVVVDADEPETVVEFRVDARSKFPSLLAEEQGVYEYRVK
jgi:aerobic C4-dicarboxylate transport protein